MTIFSKKNQRCSKNGFNWTEKIYFSFVVKMNRWGHFRTNQMLDSAILFSTKKWHFSSPTLSLYLYVYSMSLLFISLSHLSLYFSVTSPSFYLSLLFLSLSVTYYTASSLSFYLYQIYFLLSLPLHCLSNS